MGLNPIQQTMSSCAHFIEAATRAQANNLAEACIGLLVVGVGSAFNRLNELRVLGVFNNLEIIENESSYQLFAEGERAYLLGRVVEVLVPEPDITPGEVSDAKVLLLQADVGNTFATVVAAIHALFLRMQYMLCFAFYSEQKCHEINCRIAVNDFVFWASLYNPRSRNTLITQAWEQGRFNRIAEGVRQAQNGDQTLGWDPNAMQAAITASMNQAQPPQLSENLRDQGAALLRELAGNDLSLLEDMDEANFNFFGFKVAHYYVMRHPDAVIPTFLNVNTRNAINAFRTSKELQGHLAQITPESAAEQEFNEILALNAADLDAKDAQTINNASVRAIVGALKGIASQALQGGLLFSECWMQAAPL